MENPISATAYNGKSFFIRYCVQWKSLYPLLRTIEILACVTAYAETPCGGEHPGSPEAAGTIHKQNPLLLLLSSPHWKAGSAGKDVSDNWIS